jgi:peptide/nickel transport system permease protein
MHFTVIFGGSVLVETVFNIAGVGRLMVNATLAHDYPIIQTFLLFISILVLFINFIVDMSYGWIDPRIRRGDE